MVILIGAESLTGKTFMAQKLLEAYRIPYLSADHLKMGLYRANENCGFKPDDDNDVIEKYLWPIIKGIADTNIENGQSIIIEGCYIFPPRIREFSNEYRNQIIPVFMGFSKQYLENNFVSGLLKYQSVIEQRETEDRPLEWFVNANEKLRLSCVENDIRYFEIDKNYNDDISKIYKWIALEVTRIKNMNAAG
jgi:putative acetyltransferase